VKEVTTKADTLHALMTISTTLSHLTKENVRGERQKAYGDKLKTKRMRR
jgi:hypothetical protein